MERINGSYLRPDDPQLAPKARLGWMIHLSNSELAQGCSPLPATDAGSYAAETAVTTVMQKVLSVLTQFYATGQCHRSTIVDLFRL